MRILSAFAVAASLLTLPVAARATPFQSIVVYGDSLSDNGNLYSATGGFAPAPPYVNGRFSNGAVAVEQLAGALGVPLLDFAFGGATTGIGNIGDGGTPDHVGFAGLPGMESELQGSIARGLLPSDVADSLFLVWGGANDFEALHQPTVDESKAAADAAAARIDYIVTRLQGLGATNILVPNLPNLGGTPEFSGSSEAEAFSTEFNAALAATLPEKATLFDTATLFNSLLTDPAAYGFTNTTSACTDTGTPPACTGYLFFDDIHPTTAADTILADRFGAATPEPSSLVMLLTGAGSVVGVLRLRRRGGPRD